jgi:hypothetical protein
MPLCRTLLLLALAFGASTSVFGQTKAPWLWTVEERIQARRDPRLRQERVERYMRRAATDARAHTPMTRPWDVVEGNYDPQLFFPTELFARFVKSSFITLPGVRLLRAQEYSTSILRTPAEWQSVEPLVAPLVSNLRRESDLVAALASKEHAQGALRSELAHVLADRPAVLCAALSDVRALFGAGQFDRFLYEVEAKGSFIVHETGPRSGSVQAFDENVLRTERQCAR